MFPVSDKSSDIIKALASYLKEEDVHIRLNTAVKGIRTAETGFLADTGPRKLFRPQPGSCYGRPELSGYGQHWRGHALCSGFRA